MGTIRDASRVLAEAESSLRQLIEAGLKEQRYADVAEIAGLADGLSRLLNGRRVLNAPHETAMPPSPAPAATPKPKAATKSPKSQYPRFERDGDKLIKIGWSKK